MAQGVIRSSLRASRDRITRIKQDWQAYVTGIEEMKLHHKALGIKISGLLPKWEAEDRARRVHGGH